jgi:hypothetical protein
MGRLKGGRCWPSGFFQAGFAGKLRPSLGLEVKGRDVAGLSL